MPELLPFRALRYNASVVPDLSAVLCPPYDVISPADRERLARLDARNAVHIELPAPDPGRGGPSYDEAARIFELWHSNGTLMRDERPLIYVYEQRYRATDGSERACRGFFCRLRLEAFGSGGGVRPHEHTMAGPKEDRYRLMSAVQANLSPVLFLYDDGGMGAVARAAIDSLTASPPDIEAVGPGGLLNRLWLADPVRSEPARELLGLAGERPLTIADGHHRYETCLRFRDSFGEMAGAEYVLALLFEAHSGGLALRPWHRVLRGTAVTILEAVQGWFSLAPLDTPERLLTELASAPPRRTGVLGLWTREGGGLLEVDRARVGSLLSDAASETLRWLDVSVLSATLSRMVGNPTDQLAADGLLTYTDDATEAIAEVQSDRADAVFLLRPTPIDDVLAVAAAGEKVPAKSTLFYPKAATGLVFNPLAD